jgi:hypothetical protein
MTAYAPTWEGASVKIALLCLSLSFPFLPRLPKSPSFGTWHFLTNVHFSRMGILDSRRFSKKHEHHAKARREACFLAGLTPMLLTIRTNVRLSEAVRAFSSWPAFY